MRQGEEFSGWTPTRLIKRSGNAEVWEAEKDAERAALKILTRKTAEARTRFLDEIKAMRRLEELVGVMPVLEAGEREGGRKNPWFAMPVSTTVRDALGHAPSPDAGVGACSAFASTLAEAAELGVFHRDLKPENLFCRGEVWTVGDWGLVDFPDKAGETQVGKLGSAFYMAPEMLEDASSAAPGPADVYSLAKVLWVLIAHQSLPPQGPYRGDPERHRLTARLAHPKIYLLDRLIERATRPSPSERPSMKEFAEELAAWRELRPAPGFDALLEVGDVLYARLSPSDNAGYGPAPLSDPTSYFEVFLCRQWAANALVELADQAFLLGPCGGLPVQDVEFWNLVRPNLAGPDKPKIVSKDGYIVTINGPAGTRLQTGISLALDDGEFVRAAGGHWFWNSQRLVSELAIQEHSFRLGSAAEEINRRQVKAFVYETFAEAFTEFMAQVAGPDLM